MEKKKTPRRIAVKANSKNPKKTDRQEFSIMRREIERLGFTEIPPERKIKEGWIQPDAKRMKEIYDALSFELKIGDYTIELVTPFNMVLKERNGKKVNGAFSHLGGGFWIHINDKKIKNRKEQALFTRKRHYPKDSERRTIFRKRFLEEVKAVVWGLKNRPRKTKEKGKMILFDPSASRCHPSAQKFKETFDRLKSKIYEPMWVTNNSINSVAFKYFIEGVPENLKKIFRFLNKWRERYHKNRHVDYTENEIKKPWELDSSKNYAATPSC